MAGTETRKEQRKGQQGSQLAMGQAPPSKDIPESEPPKPLVRPPEHIEPNVLKSPSEQYGGKQPMVGDDVWYWEGPATGERNRLAPVAAKLVRGYVSGAWSLMLFKEHRTSVLPRSACNWSSVPEAGRWTWRDPELLNDPAVQAMQASPVPVN